MGNKLIRTPKYIKNFNIENRAAKKLEKNNVQVKVSPRHPSTVEKFKKIEGDLSFVFSVSGLNTLINVRVF